MGSRQSTKLFSCCCKDQHIDNSQESTQEKPVSQLILKRIEQVLPDDDKPLLEIMELYETLISKTSQSIGNPNSSKRNRSFSLEINLKKDKERVRMFTEQLPGKNLKQQKNRSWSMDDDRRKHFELSRKKLYGILKRGVQTSKSSQLKKKNKVSFHLKDYN